MVLIKKYQKRTRRRHESCTLHHYGNYRVFLFAAALWSLLMILAKNIKMETAAASGDANWTECKHIDESYRPIRCSDDLAVCYMTNYGISCIKKDTK